MLNNISPLFTPLAVNIPNTATRRPWGEFLQRAVPPEKMRKVGTSGVTPPRQHITPAHTHPPALTGREPLGNKSTSPATTHPPRCPSCPQSNLPPAHPQLTTKNWPSPDAVFVAWSPPSGRFLNGLTRRWVCHTPVHDYGEGLHLQIWYLST